MDYREAVRNEILNITEEMSLLTLLKDKQRERTLDELEIRAAALSLSTIYGGLERILLYCLRDEYGISPDGPNWHTKLLDLAVQKSLLSTALRQDLKGFLAFRHFVRHAYSFELDPVMIDQILSRAPSVVHALVSEVHAKYLERPDP